ncbi:hypothetical protein CBR_g51489 [Chara braunii]|uniref:Uncharacterized protein n=1 Tax=Chara braunii TaxID=69332 RepID=A0A388K6F6_CHABU|nr:hypothetical protein CBR_g51489 [Chara braunii]|eukprot:GBG65606.1 hypothetical protein CBR_g51489 [Chara braunii]
MGQATLAAIIFLDDTWEEDFPADPTGEEKKAKAFVLKHLVVCQWTAIAVLAVELFGLLLSLTLKAMQEGGRRRGGGYDSDDEYTLGSRSAIRQPLLAPRVQPGSMPPPMAGPPQMGSPVGQVNQGYRGLPRGPYGPERGSRGPM